MSSYEEIVEANVRLGLRRAADNKWTHCAHPDRCQGTDAGGNCRLMRDIEWDDRTCWYNSDAYRDTAEGLADSEVYYRDMLRVAKAEGRCSNCWHFLTEHVDGRCPPDPDAEWDETAA